MSISSKRVAIVTGGSRGIGRASAERLAADGFTVAIVYASNQAEADATVAAIRQGGGEALAFQADIADEQAIAHVFAQVEQQFGGLDVLVNAAGTMSLSTVEDLDLALLDRLYQTNIRGTFVVNQQAVQYLRSGGAIINFSSSVVKLALPTYAPYAATKGAVDALTLILARELRGRDITVNAVAPGPTATDLFLDGKDDATIERLAKLNPLERLGQPNDIAELVAFLAGPARWINGQVLYANGGTI
jgi:3-oxoacyl-[acyl-carrier protein] reductase